MLSLSKPVEMMVIHDKDEAIEMAISNIKYIEHLHSEAIDELHMWKNKCIKGGLCIEK